MARDLPKNITKTKNGYHVRMVIEGKYHAEYFSELTYGKEKALKKATEKRDQFAKLKPTEVRDKKYDTRFLYENPDNSTGIIGVFYKEEEGTDGKIYPYFCTTIVAEKGRPSSYARSIKKWGKGEALLQICCMRKRKICAIYGDRFDAERFDNSVLAYMKEHYLSYRENAKQRLSKCVS